MIFKINFFLVFLLLIFYGISDGAERDSRGYGLIRQTLRREFCKDVCRSNQAQLSISRQIKCLRKCSSEMQSHIPDQNNGEKPTNLQEKDPPSEKVKEILEKPQEE
ncbi:uncharacterized protein LOC141533548 [Cotesia typhae]|uniref:uncharacterized protein LOC141533548 n=1 Tax=Cotesia typhae TaxID=2053667 RepID=UPI003D688E15